MTYETDWLGTIPVFYNSRTRRASHLLNDVIDFPNLEFDPEGLNNYLDYGYCVFELTPFKDVRFLRFSSRITVDDGKSLAIQYLDDPVCTTGLHGCSDEAVWELFRSKIAAWERGVDGEIVVPTSAGFDSRLLDFFLHDKSRIRAFTYGVTRRQTDCQEPVYARKLCEILGIPWKQILLGNFFAPAYLRRWLDQFGASTHAHGMYHIEFYDRILEVLGPGKALLSGIFGDIWAGNFSPVSVRGPEDLRQLSYSHGMNANPSQSLRKGSHEARDGFWERHKELLQDRFLQPLWLVRLKIMLIGYLLRIPASLGFKPWSPFLDYDLALSMLGLPEGRRRGRQWQIDFLARNGIDLENLRLRCSRRNQQDGEALKKNPLQPLRIDLLRQVIRPAYIEWINKMVATRSVPLDIYTSAIRYPKVGGVMRRLRFSDHRDVALNAYLTLLPLQDALERREATG